MYGGLLCMSKVWLMPFERAWILSTRGMGGSHCQFSGISGMVMGLDWTGGGRCVDAASASGGTDQRMAFFSWGIYSQLSLAQVMLCP